MPLTTESRNGFPNTSAQLALALREASIDHPSFEQKLKPCQLHHCRATCCHDGAYMGNEEADVLNALIEKESSTLSGYGIKLPPEAIQRTGKSWKTSTRPAAEEDLAPDYPAHFPITRCVFLDSAHRCTLQRLSIDLGKAAWHYKPITCWMHPLNLSAEKPGARPVLRLHTTSSDPQRSTNYPGFAPHTHCGRQELTSGIPASLALSPELNELAAISGRNLLAELR